MTRRLPLAVVAAALALGSGSALGARAATRTTAPAPTTGVVVVETNLALQGASAAGTGIVLTKSGEVITNNHVIKGATTIKVIVPATRRTYLATAIGYDIADDVALLQLQGAANLATAKIGNSATLRIGQAARAVGNANGAGALVVTRGKVTGLDRTISVRSEDGEVAQLGSLVETSARLVPGDSGGPLLDAAGRVIGIDSAGSPAFAFDTAAPGYAIAINHAIAVVRQIEAQHASALVHIGATAFIGLQVQNTSGGIGVADVVPGSPAASAGLTAGDVITTLDGASLTSYTDLRTALFAHHPGDSVTVGYTDPSGAAATATLVLASGPPQ